MVQWYSQYGEQYGTMYSHYSEQYGTIHPRVCCVFEDLKVFVFCREMIDSRSLDAPDNNDTETEPTEVTVTLDRPPTTNTATTVTILHYNYHYSYYTTLQLPLQLRTLQLLNYITTTTTTTDTTVTLLHYNYLYCLREAQINKWACLFVCLSASKSLAPFNKKAI